MPSLYAVAKETLTEVEKDRILCVYLNTVEVLRKAQVDWEKCIEQSGSASVASFKKMVQNTLKKIRDKATEDDDGTTTPASTPAKTPKSSGTKRKSKAAAGDEVGTPTKKKRRGKKVKAEAVEDDEDATDVKESVE